MSSDEVVLSGTKAIRLLELEDFPRDNVFGARFYDGNDDGIDERIIRFSEGIIVTEKREISNNWLRKNNAELIFTNPNPALDKLVVSTKTANEKIIQNLDDELKMLGVPSHKLIANEDEKIFVLKALKLGRPPNTADRTKFFLIIKKSEDLHWASKVFADWLGKIEQNNYRDPVGRLHLSYTLRHSGRLKEAIKVSNVVEFSYEQFQCPKNIMAILATIRAAVFLDIFELHRDPQLLFYARKTINKSWAINKSDEASQVYNRLDAFEREVSRDKYIEKVNNAYVDWASWV
ncbi:MAG: hypothetical protein ACON4W_07060 [Parvibaculales bacterium]